MMKPIVKASDIRMPSPQTSPPAKKLKVGPIYKLEIPSTENLVAGSAWKQVLKTQKRGSTPSSPVRSVFDARYPLNEVLSNVADSGDGERVKSLGVKETLSAVKSYRHYISELTHLAEGAIDRTVIDNARMEDELRGVRKELTECKAKRDQLRKEKQEYLAEKTRLDSEVERLAKEEERLTAELAQTKKDWENAQVDLESCNEALGGVAAHFPKLAEGTSLAVAVEELKESVTASFGEGFNLALAQSVFFTQRPMIANLMRTKL